MTPPRRAAAGLLLVALTTAACTSEPTVQRGATTVRESSAQAADPSTISAATAFGSVVLPPGVEVLAADTGGGIDTYYRLTVRTDAAGADALRTASGVTAVPGRLYPPVPTVAAGPALAAAPGVTSTRDVVRNAAGSRVNRTVIVDGRDPAATYVHLELFTT